MRRTLPPLNLSTVGPTLRRPKFPACRLRPTNGETAIELEAGKSYILFVIIREFFECVALIAQMVPFAAIIMSFFL